MIGNWELYGMSQAELFYVLADAHLEAAIVLANALRDGGYAQVFSHAKVIMSLHHHAVELFLKYALSRSGQNPPTHHHIRDLAWRYSIAYSDPELHFDPPFVTAFMGFTPARVHDALTEEYDSKNRNRTDQEMRYHTDREGNVWPGAQGVIPDTYAQDLVEFREQLGCLHERIEKRIANQPLHGTARRRADAAPSVP